MLCLTPFAVQEAGDESKIPRIGEPASSADDAVSGLCSHAVLAIFPRCLRAIHKRSLVRSASMVLAIGFSTLPALAQTSANGAIRGHVTDPTGAVLPDTTITAVSSTAPAPLTVVSDSEGYYRLLELPPGEYELAAERSGFARFVRPGIAVRAGLNLAVDIDMVLGSQTETVAVKADTPMLESSSAVQAINIDGEFQRDLPLTSRRDWADSLGLAPGVVSTQNGAGKVFYYLHGADFSSLVMQVDGADVASTLQNTNGYVNLSTEAIQDVQIKTGAVDASTPIGTGAVLNVVTQSGTNHFKGAVGIAYQDDGWNANNAPGGTTTGFGIVQPDASLGGPIRADRLWFFAAYRYTNNSLGVSRTPAQLANLHALVPGFQPFTQDAAASYFFAKATAQLPRSHVVEAFWQRDRSPENAVGPNWGGEFLTRDFGGIATGGRWTSVWTNSLTSRVNVAFNDKGIRAKASSDLTSVNVHQNVFASAGRLIGTGTLVILDSVPSVATQPAQKLTLSADATWYRDSRVGSHELQGGVYLQPRLRERTTLQYANGGFALEEVVLRDPANPAAGYIPFHRQIYDLATGAVQMGRQPRLCCLRAGRVASRRPIDGQRRRAGGRHRPERRRVQRPDDEQHRDRAALRRQLPAHERRPHRGSRQLGTRGRRAGADDAIGRDERVRRSRSLRHQPRWDIRDHIRDARRVGPIDRSRAGRRPSPAVHG